MTDATVSQYKEVRFDKYCPKCKNFKTSEDENPCQKCVSNPVNFHSVVPTEYEEMPKK